MSVNRSGGLEYSWVMSNNVVVRIVAQSTASTGTGRQYDLFVNGQSFFSVPKVFELGIKGERGLSTGPVYSGQVDNSARDYAGRDFARPPSDSGRPGQFAQPVSAQQEAEDVRIAVERSLQESRQYLESRASNPPTGMPSPTNGAHRPATAPAGPEVDLLDFGPVPTPQSIPNHGAIVTSGNPAPSQWNQHFGAAPVPISTPTHHNVPYQQPVGAYGETASLPPQPHADSFAPRERTYTDISSQIMQSYTGQNQPVTNENNMPNMNAPPTQISVVQKPGQQQHQYASPNPGMPPRHGSFGMQDNNVQPQLYHNNMQASPVPMAQPQNAHFNM